MRTSSGAVLACRRARCSAGAGRVRVLTAATPTFWTVATQTDFLKGDVENLSIDSDGRVFLGPATALLAETAAPFLWTVARAARRHALRRIGERRQGRPGRPRRQDVDVLRLRRARGARDRAGARRRALRRDLARRQDLPGRADGTSRIFFDPDDKYIWALAVDRAGNVFAATGDKGKIYKITPAGVGTPFYKTNTTNVVVARDRASPAI